MSVRKPIAFAVAAATLACLTVPLEARPARVKDSSDVVKATAKGTAPDSDGKQTVTVKLKIEKPFHIYANPVQNVDLVDVQTVLLVKNKAKPKSVKVAYPEGEEHRTGPITYHVYEDEVTLTAVVERAEGDKGPLQLEVHVQACTSSRCLLPGKIKLEVK